jgi:hypothetical protein
MSNIIHDEIIAIIPSTHVITGIGGEQKLQIAELRVLVLEERLRRQRMEKYGAGSEKLSNSQLEMLEQEPGV